MKLVSRRFEYGDKYTVSRLYVDGNPRPECYILEDTVRPVGVKVQNETAIPAGTYKVVIDFSNHFQKLLPHLLDVPMFEGIRIHSGNTSLDTEGCLLVGKVWPGGDQILQSRQAFSDLFEQLEDAFHRGEEITIEIQDTK
jgi:hypothetical protein